jgi:prepilin-type N-terminal cleavage/methylation domain-containing protein
MNSNINYAGLKHDSSKGGLRLATEPKGTGTTRILPTGNQPPGSLAFSLIELLVVISIIAIIAAMLFPAVKAVNRNKRIALTRAELAQIESCIDLYKIKLGHYPPDNRDPVNNRLLPGLNQLYYELDGTEVVSSNAFVDLDHRSAVLTSFEISSFFGPWVTGFVNSGQGNSDDGRVAQQFLKGLRPSQVAEATMSNTATKITVTAKILVCTVPGIDPNKPPLNNGSPALNPWCYNSSAPTNNPTSYDLWIDLLIDGKITRICNWSSQTMVVR